MAENFPGPYQIRIHYTVSNRPHVQQLNCDLETDIGPGSSLSSYNLKTRGGTPVQAQTAVDAWVALIDNLFASGATNFATAELWKYTPLSYLSTFYSVYSIGVAGTNGGAVQSAGQARMSLKTQEGGTMFLDFMETVFAIGYTDPYPFGNVDVQAIANFVISSSNWILGRDTSYPIAARNWMAGQSEALFKKIFRS